MIDYPTPVHCRCGDTARIRYKIPVHWLECGNKKCPFHMRTGYFRDREGVYDPVARDKAIEEWNRIITGK